MTDTGQPLAAPEVVALQDAANAFKTVTSPGQPRDETGKFAAVQDEEEIETPPGPETDGEAVDDDETGEIEEASEEDQPEDVAMPSSWSKEDEATWAALPAEAKAKIAEREAQRDGAVNLKFQEAANARRTAQELAAEATANRERYAQELDTLLSGIQPQRPSREMLNPNSEHYDPDAYHMGVADYEAQVETLNTLRAQRQNLTAQQERDEAKAFAELEERFRPKLIEAVPDLADQTKAPTILNEIGQYAIAAGIAPEDLPKANSLEVLTLWKAMQFDKIKAAGSRVKAQPAPPKVAAPAVRPGAVTSKHAAAKSSAQRDMDRLAKTGSVEDGAAIFKRMFKG